MNLFVILPTKYNNNDIRLEIFEKTIINIYNTNLNTEFDIECIICDSSDAKTYTYIENFIKKYIGEYKNIKIIKQLNLNGKGEGIKEGIQFILNNYNLHNDDIICIQDPEKYDLTNYYNEIMNVFNDTMNKKYICVPNRNPKSFETYPIEQQYSENFINNYISTLINIDCDWTFGPIFFRKEIAYYWLNNTFQIWDAQLLPLIQACKEDYKIHNYHIDFKYPEEQKKEEENNILFIRKRHFQMTFLIEKIEEYIKKNNFKNCNF